MHVLYIAHSTADVKNAWKYTCSLLIIRNNSQIRSNHENEIQYVNLWPYGILLYFRDDIAERKG